MFNPCPLVYYSGGSNTILTNKWHSGIRYIFGFGMVVIFDKMAAVLDSYVLVPF